MYTSGRFIWRLDPATMTANEEQAIKYNFVNRLRSVNDTIQPLMCSFDPDVQLEHVMYLMDSLCRDILLVEGWLSLPNGFISCVVDAFKLLGRARSGVSDPSKAPRYPETELNGCVGRPRLIITYQQLQHLIGRTVLLF